jgi:hypothetical protein
MENASRCLPTIDGPLVQVSKLSSDPVCLLMVVRPQHFRSHRTAPVPRESEASGPTMDIRAFIRPGPARFAALQQDRVHNGVVQQSICPLARAYIAAVVLLHNSKQRSSAGSHCS